MELVEPEDDPGSYRSPLPPDDRLWRHPSEMGMPAPERASRRSLWLVVGVAAVGAGLLSTGLVVVAVTLLAGRDGGPVERPQVLARPLTTSVSVDEGAVQAAERARPAIAQVRPDHGRRGSGVIFRSDGHLLTSASVVDGATSVRVVLADGRELPARVVGSDPETDTAVVKIDGGTFPVVTMGTAADLEVGQRAVAVGGSPVRAGGPSVTSGVVSGLHRSVRTRSGSHTMHDMVQTDASVPPESSGGALLDAGGSVVGITTAAAGGGGGSGFAVPIDVARSVADQLMASGRVVNVWIGIQGQDLDLVTAGEMDLDGGAMVADVKRNSPAERGGMAARDVIVAVNGRPIVSMGQLVVALRLSRPGAAVTLEVMRERQRHSMTVTVAERPPDA